MQLHQLIPNPGKHDEQRTKRTAFIRLLVYFNTWPRTRLTKSVSHRPTAVRSTVIAIVVVVALACSVVAQQESPPPPGKLLDLGGYRIHLDCIGKGRPTILLSPGAGDFSFDWFLVQQKISKSVRVCSYDRAGSAWSDAGPQPLTMKQEAFELHTALERAGEWGPYILVGQSLGGLVMRVFADQYPNDTAAMVLVDATSPDTTLSLNGKLVHIRELAQSRPIPDIQTMQSSPPQPPTAEELKQWADFQKQLGEPKIEPPFDRLPPEIQKLQRWASSLPPRAASSDSYLAEELAQMYLQLQRVPVPLGDKPLITIVAGRADHPPNGVNQEQWTALFSEKIDQKRGFAKLSQNSKVVFDANAEHRIQLDAPNTVINAIREVRTAYTKHIRLSQ